MQTPMPEPRWRTVFRLMSERQLMVMEKKTSLDFAFPNIARVEGSNLIELLLNSDQAT
jgi:hypothetical protein